MFNQNYSANSLPINMTSRLHKNLYKGLLVAMALSSGVAQANNNTPENNAAIDTYSAEFFHEFSPQTLYDMLEKTPGANSIMVAMNNAEQSRGFGSSGDQILINNKRISGKENSIQKELSNIQARDVDYIELIRGTRSDLDVQSNGLIINVVLKQTIDSSVLWTLAGIKAEGISAKPEFSVVYSAAAGDLKYRLGLNYSMSPTNLWIKDYFSAPDKTLTDTKIGNRHNWYQQDQLTAKVEYSATPQTAVQVSALYEKNYIDAEFISTHDMWTLNQRDKFVLVFDNDREKWEVSGDISHQLNAKNHLKLLFISNELTATDDLARLFILEDDSRSPNYTLPRHYTAKENVLRGNWKHQLDNRHSFDSGLELAINSRDEKLQFDSQINAPYRSTEINDIEEARYEGFVHYNFAASPALNIQGSLVFERSTMDVATNYLLETDTRNQVASASTRTFNYLKPRFNVRYDFDDTHQLRFNLQRTVSQLNLDDFVPGFNREETRLEETNPNLKPEVRDELSFTFEKQWQTANGSISVTPYYHRISDLITEIPLVAHSGSGNIDDAKEYGVALNSNFDLNAIGLSNTVISVEHTWRNSQMIHPFTGQSTEIESLSDNNWNLKIDQNEILPGLSVSVSVNQQSDYKYSRFDYQASRTQDPIASATVDYKINQSLKIRLLAENLLQRKSTLNRVRYPGLFTANEPSRYERRTYDRTPRYTLTLTGQF
ncbi:MAG: TonB-dependent receptor plug domain-containing protein [Psychrobium sp.]